MSQLPREITDFLSTMRGRPQSRSPEFDLRQRLDHHPANPFVNYPARRSRSNSPRENDLRERPVHTFNDYPANPYDNYPARRSRSNSPRENHPRERSDHPVIDYPANPFDNYPGRRSRSNSPRGIDPREEIPFHGYVDRQRQFEESYQNTSYREISPNGEIRLRRQESDVDVEPSLRRNPSFRELSPETSYLRETGEHGELGRISFERFQGDQERSPLGEEHQRFLFEEEQRRMLFEEEGGRMHFQEDLRIKIKTKDLGSSQLERPNRDELTKRNSRNRFSKSPVKDSRREKSGVAEKRLKSGDKGRKKSPERTRPRISGRTRPRSPERTRSRFPKGRLARSRDMRRSKSLEKRRSKSPARRRLKSPDNGRLKNVDRKVSKNVDVRQEKRRTRSPNRRRTSPSGILGI